MDLVILNKNIYIYSYFVGFLYISTQYTLFQWLKGIITLYDIKQNMHIKSVKRPQSPPLDGASLYSRFSQQMAHSTAKGRPGQGAGSLFFFGYKSATME